MYEIKSGAHRKETKEVMVKEGSEKLASELSRFQSKEKHSQCCENISSLTLEGRFYSLTVSGLGHHTLS